MTRASTFPNRNNRAVSFGNCDHRYRIGLTREEDAALATESPACRLGRDEDPAARDPPGDESSSEKSKFCYKTDKLTCWLIITHSKD